MPYGKNDMSLSQYFQRLTPSMQTPEVEIEIKEGHTICWTKMEMNGATMPEARKSHKIHYQYSQRDNEGTRGGTMFKDQEAAFLKEGYKSQKTDHKNKKRLNLEMNKNELELLFRRTTTKPNYRVCRNSKTKAIKSDVR